MGDTLNAYVYVCLCILLLGVKLSNSSNTFVTRRSVQLPISFLTFRGAVGYTSASTAIHCFAAFYFSERDTALWVVAKTHLCDGLHFIILGIQA
mmetsp:Transcript_25879/g.39761  ORF Transcript_25879/g.39761 Transcript_25879/m.39761 type:complete len:94 (+) Transcript_25879:106-387(+)